VTSPASGNDLPDYAPIPQSAFGPALNDQGYYVAGGENAWAGVKAHLDAVTERAAAPVIAKYTGVLAAADIEIFTTTTTFQIMEYWRLDRGHSGPVHL
jgi:hypothetical protein